MAATPKAKSPVQEKSLTAKQTSTPVKKAAKRSDYGSEGVTDNDIFLLPGSDYQILGALMALATAVRLFRIYQPTSVVFDEVQSVFKACLRRLCQV